MLIPNGSNPNVLANSEKTLRRLVILVLLYCIPASQAMVPVRRSRYLVAFSRRPMDFQPRRGAYNRSVLRLWYGKTLGCL